MRVVCVFQGNVM